jgi:hypothetical protein
MSWRKWFVRLLVFGVLGGCTFAVLLYQRWTDPAAVREQVVTNLRDLFPGAAVSLDGAYLNLFGGIVLSELRLSRRDDPEATDFLHVPSVVVYHDKEHLLDGKIAFRKVVFQRPRLRLQRNRAGHWNLDGLLSTGGPAYQGPIPTLVITQGTLILDDRLAGPGTPPLEITDVGLTVINDPEATVTFEGTGTSEELGALKLHGSWQRDSGAVGLTFHANGIPLTSLLVQRLAAHCPEKGITPFHLEGKADLQARVEYQPGSGVPLGYDVRCQIKDARIHHPHIPLTLEGLEAQTRCLNGQLTVERLTARSGTARVELTGGQARMPRPDQDFEGVITVSHLPLTRELADRLPTAVQTLYFEYFKPVGKASVRLEVACQGGRWLRQHYTMYPEDLRVCYRDFPHPTEHLTGVVEYDWLQNRTRVNVQGSAGGQPVTVQGIWKDAGKDADVNFLIVATGLHITKQLLDALPEDSRKMAEAFHPSGRCDGKVTIIHRPGAELYENTYLVRFHDTTVKWDDFSYLLEQVSGALNIYPDHWEFCDFRGMHHGGEVHVSGRTIPQPGNHGPRLALDISGRNIALEADLKDALKGMPGLARAWDTFAPAGRLNFAAHIDRPPDQAQDLDITLDVHGCSVEPTFFRYVLHDLCGQLRYHKDQVVLSRFTARHNQTRLSLDRGVVDLTPNGGFYADLSELRGNPILPDEDFFAALPEGLSSAVKGIGLHDPFAVRTRLIIAQGEEAGTLPDMFWDGQVWVQNAKLQIGLDVDNVTGTLACVGRHNGRQLLGLSGNVLFDKATVLKQPFHDAHARLHIKPEAPDVLLVDLYAPVFGGDLSGQARVDFHNDLRYDLNLTASQIHLEQCGRHNFGSQAQLSGIAAARVYLTGQGSGVGSLEGNGSIDVPYTTSTRLYNLPLLLDLIKFLGLRWPDRTLFEEAHASFGIHGNRVNITRLDLLGNVVSLWGRGDVNLDGSDVKLDFYPSWARVEQILPPGVRAIPPAISKTLLKIEVRGKVTGDPKDVQFYKKPVPVLVDPILQMRDLVAGKKSGGS